MNHRTKRNHITVLAIVAASAFAVVALSAQDRFTLKTPNDISFSEFKGYEMWQVIAPSQPDDESGCGSAPAPGCIKAILGNPMMIKAYSEGIPANGRAVPDGAMMAKVEWAKRREPGPPYAVTVPGPLIEVSFMVKDSKRFPAPMDGDMPRSGTSQRPEPGSRSATARRSQTPATPAIPA